MPSTLPLDLRVNQDRLWRSLMAMAAIGATPEGGVHRLALSDADRAGRDLFVAGCREAGLEVSIDAIGNIFARRAGTSLDLSPVLFGSHLDTQPNGGKFDGALGVVAALEVVRSLNDRGVVTQRPIEIVNWTNEEGARFRPAMIGSGVFAGLNSLADARGGTDAEGRSFGDELDRIGYAGPHGAAPRPIHRYFELHIEQGPVLEAEGLAVGIVTHAVGQRWYEVRFGGFASHAGTTPMAGRRDALVGAARLVEAVKRLAEAFGPPAVGTVGRLHAGPDSPNIIPGTAFLTVEFRHPETATLVALDQRFRAAVAEVAALGDLTAEVKEVIALSPTVFDAGAAADLRRAAVGLGFGHRDMVSGAGHDAVHVAAVAPAAMVFCPCVGGISHNPAEAIRPDWAAAGADVLLHAVAATAAAI